MAESQIRISSLLLRFLEPIQISLENSKGKEFDGFQIILKLEICAEKIVFNCSTLKKDRLLFVTFKKQRRRERAKVASPRTADSFIKAASVTRS